MATKRKAEPQTLPRGRHGLPRELVVENQRARIVSGMIETVAELGYAKAAIARVIKPAKVSRRTFYETFANKEDCYRAAYEASFEYLRDRVLAATSGEEWPGSARAGLEALLESLAAHPKLATFFLISPASVDDATASRHHLAMRELVEALVSKAPGTGRAGVASETRIDALAGGLSRLTAMKVGTGKGGELPALLPDLVELFLRPYVGSEEAVRVAWGDERLDRR
ncbi:MAG TPA: TetR/AcrR family transcriptional regulator [Solirubrobacterales bacterium]|nr:TetR/AcrR family transcriptional regulator [Solirubrobacterales bacterium]